MPRQPRGAMALIERLVYAVAGVLLLIGAGNAIIAPALEQAAAVLAGPLVVAAGGLLMAWAALTGFAVTGPVWASRVELAWSESGGLVRRRTRWAVGTIAVTAATCGVLAAAVAVSSGSGPGMSVVLTVAVVSVSGAVAVTGQHLDRSGLLRAVGVGCGAVAAGIVCSAAGPVPVVVLAAGYGYAAALQAPRAFDLRRGLRWHPAPPRWELRRAGDVVDGATASALMMDGAALELLRDRRLPPNRRPGPRRAGWILLVRTITSARVAVLLPLIAVPAGIAAVSSHAVAVGALQVATIIFTVRIARNLETWLDSPALRRGHAHRGNHLVVLLAGAPAGLSFTYAAAAAALASLPLTWAATAALLGLLTLLRRLSGRRMGPRVGALVATPMGGVPVDLTRRVLAGPDVAIVAPLVTHQLGTAASLFGATVLTIAYLLVVTSRGH